MSKAPNSKGGKETGSTGDGSLVKSRKKLSAAQMAANDRLDIGTNLLDLFWKEPFYARLYRHLGRIRTRQIPTAGVGVKDAVPTLWWNPDFLAELDVKQGRGLLKHEAMHLIYGHCTTRRYEPHFIWNWSTDCAINCTIPLEELPKGGFNPGHPFPVLTDEEIAEREMTPEDVERYYEISKLVASFPPNKLAEWYFTQFMQNQTVQDMVAQGEAIQGFLDKMAECLGGGGDVHDAWDLIPEEQRDLIDGKMRKALEDAVSHADNTNGWGTVPGEMRETLRAMLTNEIDWKQVLRSFIGRTRRADSRNSIKKINRKQPYVFPGRTRNYTANVWIYVDESGSVGDDDLALLFGELNNLAKLVTFRVIPFTYGVHEENAWIWKKGQTKPTVVRTNCGGTDFSMVVEHANKHKDMHDGVLILTDGYAPEPGRCRKRLGWVITPTGSKEIHARAGEVVIRLKAEGKEAACHP